MMAWLALLLLAMMASLLLLLLLTATMVMLAVLTTVEPLPTAHPDMLLMTIDIAPTTGFPPIAGATWGARCLPARWATLSRLKSHC